MTMTYQELTFISQKTIHEIKALQNNCSQKTDTVKGAFDDVMATMVPKVGMAQSMFSERSERSAWSASAGAPFIRVKERLEEEREIAVDALQNAHMDAVLSYYGDQSGVEISVSTNKFGELLIEGDGLSQKTVEGVRKELRAVAMATNPSVRERILEKIGFGDDRHLYHFIARRDLQNENISHEPQCISA